MTKLDMKMKTETTEELRDRNYIPVRSMFL